MKVKYLRELIDGLDDQEEIFYWVTTPDEMKMRMEETYPDEPYLSQEEYELFIQLLQADDEVSDTTYQAENYILEKLINKRNKTEEGNS